MSSKVDLDDLRIPRNEDGEALAKYVETDMGEVGYKPQSIGSLEELSALARKDDEEANKDELISILKEIILEPDLSEVSDEELKSEFDFEKLKNLLATITEKVRGPMQPSRRGGSGNQ